jgi:hypothetical protein
MICARQKWESRWRRLPFYIAYETHEVLTDDLMALRCLRMIVQDIWKATSDSWQSFLDICNHHVGILEDKIYENMADESRASELWTNSSKWLKVERLMFVHIDLVKECGKNLREMAEEPVPTDAWLESAIGDFDRLSNLVQEDLVKPTANLTDMMYKSVGIRDSRHSLQLASSMARLSWITFVFLPLSFLSGFFGMRVSTFAEDISVKWYFTFAVPMMVLVFSVLYMLKHFLERARATPYSRGVYESLFLDLADRFPLLWTRKGPRQEIMPEDRYQRWKWQLVQRWSAANKTIKAATTNDDDELDSLGTWSRVKRTLMRRWTSQISTLHIPATAFEEGKGDPMGESIEWVSERAEMPRPPGMLNVPMDLNQRVSRASGSDRVAASVRRPSTQSSSPGSGRNSQVLVEEEMPQWLENEATPS